MILTVSRLKKIDSVLPTQLIKTLHSYLVIILYPYIKTNL